MSGHLYKYTVEHLEGPKGRAFDNPPLTFERRNHDDLFKIVEKMKGTMGLSESDSTALVLGLKLFGEVMLKNKEVTLLKEFKPEFSKFIQRLKTQLPDDRRAAMTTEPE